MLFQINAYETKKTREEEKIGWAILQTSRSEGIHCWTNLFAGSTTMDEYTIANEPVH